jgi:hypothetical protein
MNQKQKLLLIGGATITAVVLYASFSKAATSAPKPAPAPPPPPAPPPKPIVQDAKPVVVSGGATIPGYGALPACSNNTVPSAERQKFQSFLTSLGSSPNSAEEYAAVRKALEGASPPCGQLILDVDSASQAAGAAAADAQQRAADAQAAQEKARAATQSASVGVPGMGTIVGSCSPNAQLPEPQHSQVIAFIDSVNDPDQLHSIFLALNGASPMPCIIEANYAMVRETNIRTQMANAESAFGQIV